MRLNDGLGFVAFDQIKSILFGFGMEQSTTTITVLAGLGAGVAESAFAVTPFESIKTQLIDDRKSKNPRMKGFAHGAMVIAREKGVHGFFQGFWPTTARQAANSGVRFTSYTTMKQLADKRLDPGQKVGSAGSFFMGGAAGIITVYVRSGGHPSRHFVLKKGKQIHDNAARCHQDSYAKPGRRNGIW
jgi:solute carrier family 25 citrate transporter 1